MRLIRATVASVALVFSSVATTATSATPLSWSINATFDDGGSLSGTLLYDATTHGVVGWDLSTFGGSVFSPFEYTPLDSISLPINVFTEFVFCTPACETAGARRDLRFQFLYPLTATGGVDPILPGAVGQTFGVECDNCGQYRLITQGAAQASLEVPEPSSLAIIAAGLFSLIAFRLVRSPRGAHPRSASPPLRGRMRKLFGSLIAVGLFASSATAEASIIQGTFTGLVAYAGGIAPGDPANLSGLIGSSISGSFTYDSQSLTLLSIGGTGGSPSVWASSGSSDPVVFSLTFDGTAHTVRGTQTSSLAINADETGTSNPANQFNLLARSGPTAAPGDTYGEIDIVVDNNNLGARYLSNITDVGTVFFSHESLPAGYQVSVINFYDSLGQIGVIGFGITDASAGPVTEATGVPEPSTFVLIAAGLLLVVGLGRRSAAALTPRETINRISESQKPI